MLMLEIKKLKKSFGTRTVLDINELNLYSGEKIALVGMNGAGKSLLLNIIAGLTKPDEGSVKTGGEISYIKQFMDKESEESITGNLSYDTDYFKILREFEIYGMEKYDWLSGGEMTRLKLAGEFSKNNSILMADEPASNLDINGITILEKSLKEYNGLLLLVSHDRELINSVCGKIIEIENCKINVYEGNYDFYKRCKQLEIDRKNFEYGEYISERKRLFRAAAEKKQHSKEMKKAPARMGNSEARLHTRGVNSKKSKIDAAAKSIETRIEKLELKKKAYEPPIVKIDIKECFKLQSKIAVYGSEITKTFSEKTLFSYSNFEIRRGSKTAIIGPNGSGKTTLIKMMLNGETGIHFAASARIGYFSQSLEILAPALTVIENVMAASEYSENFTRLLLARLLFKRDDIYKKVSALSGGERVRAALAKIFVCSNNVLLFDEPTNYLDVQSLEALEAVLREYEGTLIFASHDRKFISNLATELIIIEGRRLNSFSGTYGEYLESRNQQGSIVKNKAGDCMLD
ncbi:MAG: ABC-F type ribosomal protection protein [Candidatus Wallbacteria bacterium]